MYFTMCHFIPKCTLYVQTIEWVKHNLAVINEYQGLLLNLISAHTFYLRAVLRMIVRELVPKKSDSVHQFLLHVIELPT